MAPGVVAVALAIVVHRQRTANVHDNPKPFVWTAKASGVLEKVKRARAALDNR